MAVTQVSGDGIANNTVSIQDCNWYSQDVSGTVGALKLPRGNTSERPTTATGGRENISFDLSVTVNVESGDPGFLQNEPWLWSWAANYNRTSAATNETDTSSLVLFRGSTYTFNNYAVGHGLYLRHTEKTNAGDADDVFTLSASDGITGTQGIKSVVGSNAPGVIVWTIPTNYSYNQVVIQHAQTGMANVITVSDPPAETIGYIRMNTDAGDAVADLEVYTGRGWKTLAFSDSSGAQEQPTGTLSITDNGLLTDAVATTVDDGLITNVSSPGTRDNGGLLLLAFLSDNLLGVNSNNALFVHDGSTPGGYELMKADQSNLKTGTLINKRFTMYRFGSQTCTGCNIVGSNGARIDLTNTVEDGIGGFTLEDSNQRIRITKDMTNSYLKFDLKFRPNQNCTLELWKNGSRVTYADYDGMANFHNTFSWMEACSFDDTLEFRIYNSSQQNITLTNNDILIIEFVGS